MISKKIYQKWMGRTQREKIRQILFETRPEGKILDVGAGPGFLEEEISAIATDTDLEGLKKIKGLKVLCSGDALPFKERNFDWVFCIDTVHLLNGVEELERVSNGKIVLSTFCNENNFAEKLKWLKSLTKRKIKKEFLVRGKLEWDAVIVV